VSDPTIEQPIDAIVQIDSTTICGTDLHILKRDVPDVKPGTILGHEAIGTVVETGSAVTTLSAGDRVLVSCITSCGRCRFSREGRYGPCTGGGWILGHLIDGLQAEYARVPFADTSLYKVPSQLDDKEVLFLADILPTAYEVGVLNGGVEPGDVIAVVGVGPIGLATILTARLVRPAHTSRDRPRRLAARASTRVRRRRDDQQGQRRSRRSVMQLTGGLGADVVTTGLVDTFTTPKLLSLIAEGRLDALPFATHHYPLSDAMAAYDTFADAAHTHALKVVLSAEAAPLRGVKEELFAGAL
jgi:alcohol dehydrogenase